jgi:rare lipoprotein A
VRIARATALRTLAAAPLAVAASLGLTGCFTSATRPVSHIDLPPSTAPLPPPPTTQGIPDAVPKVEPRSRYGNPPFYDVFGRRYYVLSSSVAYVERGVASWYGPGFHEVRTSTREPYDMYAMTAAHKTLPLPAYVRVTNLQNGRSVVVRVNDRGPFVGNRIIDLSYTAAAKLDMLRDGTAMVEVRAIDPSAPAQNHNAPLLASAPMAAANGQGTALTASAPQAAATATLASANGVAPAMAPAPTLQAATGSTATLASASGVPRAMAPQAATGNAVSGGTTGAPTSTPGVAPGAAPGPTIAGASTAPAGNAVGSGAAAPSAPSAGAKVPLFVQAGAFADPANAEHLAAKLRGGAYGKIFVRDDVIAGRKMYRVRIGPVPNVPEFDRIVATLERAGVHDVHLALD